MNKIFNEGMQIEAFKKEVIPSVKLYEESMADAVNKLERNLTYFRDCFPSAGTKDGVYQLGTNTNWTPGFWTGMMWLAYEQTGKESFRKAAELQVKDFIHRMEHKIDVDHHDMGFLYSLSCIAAYKLTGNVNAEITAVKAADQLIGRYIEPAGVMQSWSWGKYGTDERRGNVIIDSLMNLPLLYWASQNRGDDSYAKKAEKHAEVLLDTIIRPDASTYHMFNFDPFTGAPKHGETAQGYSDNSCWSRGQAWGIYGYVLSYKYTKNLMFLDTAKALANYFLNRSPEDFIVYWDFEFKEGSGQLKDSSASAIVVCGLLEMIQWLPESKEREYYQNAALTILHQLCTKYSSSGSKETNALLLHVVGSIPHGSNIDVSTLYGDYFYLEALVRATKDWVCYW